MSYDVKMVCICGFCFRVILFLQALVGIGRMQDCLQVKHRGMTAITGDDVKFKSDPYSLQGLIKTDIVFKRQHRWIAYIRPDFEGGDGSVTPRESNVFGEVSQGETANNTNILTINVTITITYINETDSDVYTLQDRANRITLNCWSLYVLGERKYGLNRDYFEEKTPLSAVYNLLPHLSEEIAKNMTVNLTWQLEDWDKNERLPSLTTRAMDCKTLIYTIQGLGHSPTSVTYTLNITYTGPIVIEPNGPITDGTIQSITCIAYCNPICEVTWKREDVVISNDSILQPGSVLPGIKEYVCHVKNTATGKKRFKSIFIYYGSEQREQRVPFKTLVYVFASLTAVFVLVLAVLVVQLWGRDRWSCIKPRFLQQKPHTGTMAMGEEPVAASAPVNSADRPVVSYDDLQARGGQEKTYDSICTGDRQTEDRRTPYENLF